VKSEGVIGRSGQGSKVDPKSRGSQSAFSDRSLRSGSGPKRAEGAYSCQGLRGGGSNLLPSPGTSPPMGVAPLEAGKRPYPELTGTHEGAFRAIGSPEEGGNTDQLWEDSVKARSTKRGTERASWPGVTTPGKVTAIGPWVNSQPSPEREALPGFPVGTQQRAKRQWVEGGRGLAPPPPLLKRWSRRGEKKAGSGPSVVRVRVPISVIGVFVDPGPRIQ
jgi:hypothetical protein